MILKSVKTVIVIAGLMGGLSLAGCNNYAVDVAPAAAASAVQERAKAVLIYADWCASCKVLQPKVDAVRGDYEGKGLKFVTLDYTSKDKKDLLAQARKAGVFEATVKALGDHVKTGQIIFVSTDGKRVLSKGNMTHTEDEIARSMLEAISG